MLSLLSWSDPAALNSNAGTDSGRDDDPQLTTDGQGCWVAVWNCRHYPGPLVDDYDVLFARSTDGGRTWSAPRALNTNAYTARLFDSPGDDIFRADPTRASLSGDGFNNRMDQFEAVHAYATPGNDTAQLYANGRGGVDEAELRGSADQDRFFGDSQQRVLFSDDYRQQTEQFEKVRVLGGGSNDTIDLVSAVFDEGYTQRPIEGPSAEFASVAWRFDFAELQTRDEPADPKTIRAIDNAISAYWD